MTNMAIEIIIWIAAIILFAVLEACTVSMTSVWFCGGAAVALIAAGLQFSLQVQVVLFVVVSAVLLACLRPMAKRLTVTRREHTNADRILGQQAMVTEAIDPIQATGAVRVNGVEWTARCTENVAAGSVVTIDRIEGVKVWVTPAPADESASVG